MWNCCVNLENDVYFWLEKERNKRSFGDFFFKVKRNNFSDRKKIKWNRKWIENVFWFIEKVLIYNKGVGLENK